MSVRDTLKRGRHLRDLLMEPVQTCLPSMSWRAVAVFLIMGQLLMVDSAMAQVSTPSIVAVASSPSGQSCSANLPLKLKTPDGTLWSCQNGIYAQVGSTSGGTISSITSTGSTLTVTNGTGPTANAEINPAHSNTWTALQGFNAGTTSTGGFYTVDNGATQKCQIGLSGSNGPQINCLSSSAGATTRNVQVNITSSFGDSGLWAGGANAFSTPLFTIGVIRVVGDQVTDSLANDTVMTTSSGSTVRIGINGTASTMQVNGTNVTVPSIKSTTGQRFVCVDTSGNMVSSASPCVGT